MMGEESLRGQCYEGGAETRITAASCRAADPAAMEGGATMVRASTPAGGCER
jgi:hypothetical protein